MKDKQLRKELKEMDFIVGEDKEGNLSVNYSWKILLEDIKRQNDELWHAIVDIGKEIDLLKDYLEVKKVTKLCRKKNSRE